MKLVEKTAYLKGLVDGLGVEPGSRDGKLWGALTDLLGDMARDIQALHEAHEDVSELIDGMCESLEYLEELADDGGFMDWDNEDWDPEEAELLEFPRPEPVDDEEEPEEDDESEESSLVYDVTCPNCGESIEFDEETLETGSIKCPQCGEILTFALGEDETDKDE